ncbi:MAG: class I SAM-dependent methyltransferase [Rhizobiales bacterium]|nr:class I SAM-dependent methyltransferase [Hyphomicrobiales bacterium]
MSAPLPFEPHRFRVAAAHYRAGRPAYPPALIRRAAEAVGLDDGHRVLDLGCGPGPLAIGFGYFAGEVLGLDPEPNMLAAAREAAQGLTPNVRFRQASSYDLGPELGLFRLVAMGRSFHWMDRADTLNRLDPLVEAGGAVVLFNDSHCDLPDNAWCKTWDDIVDRYSTADATRKSRKAEGWLRHEAFLLASPFCRLEQISIIARQVSTVESLVARALSMSSTSQGPADGAADDLAREVREALDRIAPDGRLTEVVEWSALVAKRR